MTLNNRTVAINQSWVGRAVAASLLAGAAGYLPFWLYPRDVIYGWIEELLPILVCAVPSFIGAFWGRFWLPNLMAALILSFGYLSQSFGDAGLAFCGGVLAAATMSYLAGRWHLVDGKPRAQPADSHD